MSLGAALYAEAADAAPMDEIIGKIRDSKNSDDIVTGDPLFRDRAGYDEFIARHKRSDLSFADIYTYTGTPISASTAARRPPR